MFEEEERLEDYAPLEERLEDYADCVEEERLEDYADCVEKLKSVPKLKWSDLKLQGSCASMERSQLPHVPVRRGDVCPYRDRVADI